MSATMLPLSVSAALFLGGLVSQERPLTDKFHQVAIAGGIKATVKKGTTAALTLKGEAADLERIEVVVKGGTLTVQPKSESGLFNALKRHGTVTAELTVVEFDGLELSGASSATGDGISGPKCNLEQSGASSTELNGVACEALSIDASGASQVNLKGTAKNLDLDASGGGKLQLDGLGVTNAKVDGSGGTRGVLAVKGALEVEASGGSSIKVKGEPKVARMDKSGGASVTLEK